MNIEHPWIKAAKYLGVRKTRANLDRSVREYKLDLLHRRVVHDAVCAAIEGFCGATCEWSELETEVGYAASCSGWYRGCNEDGTCPHCNRRVIERFDILKEEGV